MCVDKQKQYYFMCKLSFFWRDDKYPLPWPWDPPTLSQKIRRLVFLKHVCWKFWGFFWGGGSIEFLPLFGRFIVLSLILLSHDEFVKNITNLPKFIPFVIYFPFGRTKYNLWIFIKLAKNLVIDICEFTNSK